jgi:hypothetical protein
MVAIPNQVALSHHGDTMNKSSGHCLKLTLALVSVIAIPACGGTVEGKVRNGSSSAPAIEVALKFEGYYE